MALITRSLMLGGAQQQIVKLCQKAPRSEVMISVFLLMRDEPGDLLPEVPSDVRVLVSPFSRHHPRVVGWLADGLRKQRIQVAHSFLWTADAFAILSRALYSRVPLICSERGDRGDAYYTIWKNLYDRLMTFRLADSFCANSSFGRSLLIDVGCDPGKVGVIYNGVDLRRVDSTPAAGLRRLLGWPDDCFVVGMVGRMTWYKAVDTLLRAIAAIDVDSAVYCVLIGDGPEREGLEQLASTLGIGQRVAFLGSRSPAIPFVKDFDVGVLATRTMTEHCSNSIQEYMACRKPVIATHVGGNPELVTVDETGFLVEPDDPTRLAQAILGLARNRMLATKMGVQGRERVERDFAIETAVTRFTLLWRRVAEE